MSWLSFAGYFWFWSSLAAGPAWLSLWGHQHNSIPLWRKQLQCWLLTSNAFFSPRHYWHTKPKPLWQTFFFFSVAKSLQQNLGQLWDMKYTVADSTDRCYCGVVCVGRKDPSSLYVWACVCEYLHQSWSLIARPALYKTHVHHFHLWPYTLSHI